MKDNTTYPLASDFIPIHSLSREDADIHLVFLSGNGIVYRQPSDDIWYGVSTTPTDLLISSSVAPEDKDFMLPIYLPLEPASPLGCAEQHQFCRSSDTRQCGPLASLRDAIAGVAPYFGSSYARFVKDIATTPEEAFFLYTMYSLHTSPWSVTKILRQLGPKALQSSQRLMGGNQGPLSSNQWQLDVTNWFQIGKAGLQAAYADIAYGPTDPNVLRWRVNFTSPELSRLCRSQV